MNRLGFGVLMVALVVVAQAQVSSISQVVLTQPNFVPGEVIVQLADRATESAQTRLLNMVGGKVASRIQTEAMKRVGAPALMVVRVDGDPRQAAEELMSDPNVRFAEPNWTYRTQVVSNDPQYTGGSLWGMYGDASPLFVNQFGSQAAELWNANKIGSSTVYVGVIDEGVFFSHSDLAANMWLNPFDPADGVDNDGNGRVDDTRGWDFAGNNNSVYDGTADDHGTHVAGTIGAVGGNGIGVAGVCWNVKMIPAKFLGSTGGTTTAAIQAIDYLTDLKNRHGLNIVATNNSWGGGGFSQALQDAIERANQAGILFIAAAGNNGSNNDSVANYPSNYPNANIIAVGSITSTGARSSFSNFGQNQVDLFAPGSSIISTVPGRRNASAYASYSGTSMATPHVAGAAAMYKAINPSATAAQIRTAILSATTPTTSVSTLCVTGGRLNIGGW